VNRLLYVLINPFPLLLIESYNFIHFEWYLRFRIKFILCGPGMMTDGNSNRIQKLQRFKQESEDDGKQKSFEIREESPTASPLKKAPTLQHAHNPVDWYPWGSEAFEKQQEKTNPSFSQAAIPHATGAM